MTRVDFSDTVLRLCQSAIPLLALSPLLASLLYVLSRTGVPLWAQAEAVAVAESDEERAAAIRAQDLLVLAALHNAGKLTDGEYAVERAHVIRTAARIGRVPESTVNSRRHT